MEDGYGGRACNGGRPLSGGRVDGPIGGPQREPFQSRPATQTITQRPPRHGCASLAMSASCLLPGVTRTGAFDPQAAVAATTASRALWLPASRVDLPLPPTATKA